MTPDSSANTPTWNVATAIHKHIVKQNIHVNLHSKAGRPACINKNIMGHIVENSKEKENPDSI